ncbi:MAG TPA: hypothetical protein VGS27_04820 [Candidatus Sulfotelmatobacter sp.]|nr:hypothetical protein [Candidatus Sulfotelmatobacter sp.]
MIRPAVLAVLLLLSFASGLRGSDCGLKTGLYQARKNVVAQYAREVGNDYAGRQALADTLLKQQKEIDRQYHSFMERVSQTGSVEKRAQAEVCCRQTGGDPIAHLICGLATYLRDDRRDPAAFLESVPADKESANALWALDEIASSQGDETGKAVAPFGPSGPVDRYLHELFRLTANGEPEAIKKYLGLYPLADGEYAESMEDQLERLFFEHPAVILRHWALFKADTRIFADLKESLSSEQKQRIVSGAKANCSIDRTACKELIAEFH